MKVLQINSYYNFGSTGKIAKDINDYLQSIGEETYVCYTMETGFNKDGKTHFFKYGLPAERYFGALITRFNGNRYGNAFLSTLRLKKYINKIKPDIVHIHCPNSYDVNLYSLIKFLKVNKYNTVITEHAEFYHTGNCAYAFECDKWVRGCSDCPRLYYSIKSKVIDATARNWKRMKKAFCGFDTAVLAPVSGWLGERTAISGITENIKCKAVLNGINTDYFKYYEPDEISEEIKGYFTKKTVLFVTSDFNSPVKGGNYVLELAKMLPEYNFLVVCSGEVDTLGLSNVKHIGFIKNQKDLATVYSLADVTLLASKRETFSMPVAESLCCGTPVVGFFAGGPESIAIEEYCDFVEYGNIEMLKEALIRQMNSDYNPKEIAIKAKDKYSFKTMARCYCELYRELLENDRNQEK